MPSQVCTRCNLEHHKSQFPDKGPEERLSMCIKCRRQDRDRVDAIRGRRVRKAWLDRIKAESGCNDCNEMNPIVLQFHHKNPSEKYMTLSRMIAGVKSYDRMQSEVDKCDILCANCHLLHHSIKKP